MAASTADAAAAGTAASVLSAVVLYPLDAIRTRVQGGHAASSSDAVRQAVRSPDGLASLYDGLGATVVTTATSSAIYFTCYNSLKAVAAARSRGKQLSTATALGVAYVAGAVNATLTCPMWTVATRMKLAGKRRHRGGTNAAGGDPGQMSPVAMLLDIVRQEGARGCFNGLAPALVLCSNPAIQFVTYETLKRWVLRRRRVGSSLSDAEAFVVGAVAKAVATVVTYPVQTIQVATQSDARRGVWNTARRLARQRRLYDGLRPKLTQTVTNSAVMFLLYERLLRVVLALRRRLGRRPPPTR